MCGIVGAIGFSESFVLQPELLPAMCDRIAHRGPDGKDFWNVLNLSLLYKAII